MKFRSLIDICLALFSAVTAVSSSSAHFRVPADRICKPGPPLLTSTARKKCLIIGDSISIGYTPWVAAFLKQTHQVQHSPWDTTDGGALDSKYGVRCLKRFLSSVMLEPTKYDVIVFNFGMHDIEYNSLFPEEYTSPFEYKENLGIIKSKLLSTGANVGYVLTTPVPWNVMLNNRVKEYNRIANRVMTRRSTITIADLYDWVVEECGEPPYNSCIIADKQPSPHYTKEGYRYLAELVKDLVVELSDKADANLPIPRKDTKPLGGNFHGPVQCKNKFGKAVTVCPPNTTCCNSLFSHTGKGCCLLPAAQSCDDGKHCCPAGYECDSSCSIHACFCLAPTKRHPGLLDQYARQQNEREGILRKRKGSFT